MIEITRCSKVKCESMVVIKCQHCKSLNIKLLIDYSKEGNHKSQIKRLHCKDCNYTWDVSEDDHTGFEEIK
jgi:hypothetical protein